ncbi:unnamed protein product [Bathycoccus prasinos]
MKNAIAPTHASKTFLIKMFLVFLDLTEPAHNIANPACIKNTRIETPPNYYPIIICGEEDREISSLIETTREKKKTTTEKKNQTI